MMGPIEIDGVPVRQVSLAEYAEHIARQQDGILEEERVGLRTEGNRRQRRAAAAKARKSVVVRALGFRPVDPDHLVVARGQVEVR